MKTAVVLVLSVVACMLQGCAASFFNVQPVPTGVATNSPSEIPVPVYTQDEAATLSGVPFVWIVASGNGFATVETIKRDLGKKGGKLGADFVVLSTSGTTTGPTITSYGNGLAISQAQQFLQIGAFGCMNSKASLGVAIDNDHVIKDVFPNGPAHKAGVRVGDRLLAINGARTSTDRWALWREIGKAEPGQDVPLEIVGADQITKTVVVKMQPRETFDPKR